ncbi:MAG: hypothetical protein ACKVQB_00530 [Bacteroidia bacterium]
MVEGNSKHELLNEEIILLKNLIGKTLTSIKCSRIDTNLTTETKKYVILDTINLKFEELSYFIGITADFDETNFGEDFITLNIYENDKAIIFSPYQQIWHRLKSFNLDIFPKSKIFKIEVYGESYSIKSDNTEINPFWNIEKNNPGKAIIENIETENKLLFYTETNQILIEPSGPVPFINIILDVKHIENFLCQVNIASEKKIRLKHSFK